MIYIIIELNDFEESYFKVIGAYTTKELAEEVKEQLEDKPKIEISEEMYHGIVDDIMNYFDENPDSDENFEDLVEKHYNISKEDWNKAVDYYSNTFFYIITETELHDC